MTARNGVLITIEGCDGCGKSTQAALLCERLTACGLPVGPSCAPGTVIREPGGTPVGEAIRDLLLHAPVVGLRLRMALIDLGAPAVRATQRQEALRPVPVLQPRPRVDASPVWSAA